MDPGSHPASCPVGGGRSFPWGWGFWGVELSTPPSGAELENAWGCASTPQYLFTEWYLLKQEMSLHGVVLGQLYLYLA